MKVLFKFYFIIVMFYALKPLAADVTELTYGCFRIEYELTLPGSPPLIYDAITGDISGWWDHSFSESPLHFYLEAKPGGGFYEIFDEEGNGVLHATVIAADRGKLLRFDGPLGLSGRAIKMVHTYQFIPNGSDSTLLKLTVNISGEIEEKLATTVDQVWKHFLFEQFKPYILENKHVMIPFEIDRKWGYKNNSGQILIKPQFYLANDFNQYGIAPVVDEQGWIYINTRGRRLFRPFIIDNGPDYFREGMARYVRDGKIGFMNEYGVSVISPKFDFVLPFSEGMSAFCLGCTKVAQGEHYRFEGGKWGYINKTGEIVIAPEYDKADSFKDGTANVVVGSETIVLRKENVNE